MSYHMEIYEAADCRRIVNVLEKHGYILTMKEAHDIWSLFSIDMDAGWIDLDKQDGDLFNTILGVVERITSLRKHFEYLS